LPYEGSGGALVRKVKFQPNLRLAGQLAERLGAAAESLPKPDAVVPIPSLPKRLRSRGFNFAEVLAKQMAFNLKVPCLSSVLSRTDDGQQSGRSDRSRRSGLSGRFLLQAKELPRHVMLVDDVLTTGGTLDGAAISLLGVCQRVSGVVVASRQI
jgi:predicted amidophosphoribosyltransferase